MIHLETKKNLRTSDYGPFLLCKKYYQTKTMDHQFYNLFIIFLIDIVNLLEARVAKQITPWTLNLKVQDSSLVHRTVSLDKEL